MNIKHFIVNVEAVISRGDKWLIIKRSEKEDHAPGALALVGGKVEVDKGNVIEDVLEKTLHREIEEEVGIEIEKDLEYVESKFFVADDNQPVVDLVFLCQYKSGEATPADPEEVADVFWKTEDEILADPNTPEYLKRSLQKAWEVKNEMDPGLNF